jgi:hypothetical protein
MMMMMITSGLNVKMLLSNIPLFFSVSLQTYTHRVHRIAWSDRQRIFWEQTGTASSQIKEAQKTFQVTRFKA